MRMNKKLLLTASVFFVIFSLVGCGVPSIFNNEISFKKNSSTDTMISGTFTFEKPARLDDIEDNKGPSLMLGYSVTDSPDPPSFSAEFNKLYRKNIYNGSSLSNSHVLSITDNNKKISLYQFSDQNNSTFKTPYLIATAGTKTSPDFTSELILNADYSILLSFAEGTYSINANADTLTRFNSEVFNNTVSDITNNSSSYPDYSISDTPGTLYCHVFGAINVSEGSFTNIFWSPLSYFGYLNLNFD